MQENEANAGQGPADDAAGDGAAADDAAGARESDDQPAAAAEGASAEALGQQGASAEALGQQDAAAAPTAGSASFVDPSTSAESPATPATPATSAASAETPAEPDAGTTPAVQLEALGLRGARGWAFRDVDLVAHPGDLVVATGASGSGRSALLLAIAGRLRPTTGSLQIAGTPLGSGRRTHRTVSQVRERVAVARIARHIGLDGNLSVTVNIRDAADWSRRRPADLQDRIDEWRERSGLAFEPHTPVAELPALEVTALHLLLAAALDPDVIVLDDADAGLVPTERAQLWQLAAAVAASGPTVIATATEVPAEADLHLVLHRHTGPAAHLASSPAPDAPDEEALPAAEQPESSPAGSHSPAQQPGSPPEPPQPPRPPEPPEPPDSLPEQPSSPEEPRTSESGRPAPEAPEAPDQPGTDRDGTEK